MKLRSNYSVSLATFLLSNHCKMMSSGKTMMLDQILVIFREQRKLQTRIHMIKIEKSLRLCSTLTIRVSKAKFTTLRHCQKQCQCTINSFNLTIVLTNFWKFANISPSQRICHNTENKLSLLCVWIGYPTLSVFMIQEAPA